MTIRAVLFDVGGPIDTEILSEQLIDADLKRALREVGVEFRDTDFDDANTWAIESFAPDAYAAILWRLSDREHEARAAYEKFAEWSPERRAKRQGIELRPGIDSVLRDLHVRGLKLGLAANQPAHVIANLEGLGIGDLFSHREVSGHHGFRKPDVRLFMRACEDLGVEPEQCIMVGDRVDNDIVPAKLLGMRTILFRTGRHVAQQPRSFAEIPDWEITDIPELTAALDKLIADG